MPEKSQVLFDNYQPEPNAFAGKTILITGAAGGLGSAIAKNAASLGAELVLLDHNQNKLNQIHDEIETEYGKQPGLYPLDMRGADIDDYQQLAVTIEDTFNGLHGLVHCAATLGQICPLDHLDAKAWQETFTTNLHAPILLTRSLLPLMRTSANGSIVFTTDNKTTAYWGAYGISKASIEAAMKIIADELDTTDQPNNSIKLTCNAINPGPMRTNLRSSAYPGEDPNSVSTPEEKVAAYLYLLSDAGRAINGEHIELALESAHLECT